MLVIAILVSCLVVSCKTLEFVWSFVLCLNQLVQDFDSFCSVKLRVQGVCSIEVAGFQPQTSDTGLRWICQWKWPLGYRRTDVYGAPVTVSSFQLHRRIDQLDKVEIDISSRPLTARCKMSHFQTTETLESERNCSYLSRVFIVENWSDVPCLRRIRCYRFRNKKW